MKHNAIRFFCILLALICLCTSALADYARLERGDKNADVLQMQLALKSLGYSLTADGNFGSGTQTAVREFQRQYGLKVDGIAGNETLTLLYALAPAYAPENNSSASGGASGIYATLRQGDSGAEVLAMQQALNQLGYNLKTDGKYGTSTKSAVMDFQKKHGLKVDGIAGSETLTQLYALANSGQKPAAPTTSPAPTPAAGTYPKLQQGDEGASVLTLQRALNRLGYGLAEDGKYGSGTKNAVMNFQRAHGLKVDGIAGNETQSLLYSLASAAATATKTPAVTPTPDSDGDLYATVVTSGNPLNLRAAANDRSQILTTIPNGARIPIYTRSGVWCVTRYAGYLGYVMTSYLAFDGTAAPSATPNPGSSQGEIAYVTTTGGSLNFRSSPSTGNNVIAQIPNGTQLYITSRSATWCATTYNGRFGYVMTSFLSFVSNQQATPTPTPAPTPTNAGASSMIAYVSTSGGSLNLRESPKSGTKILTTIPNGTALIITQQLGSWCATTYKGYSGYVMTSYLRFTTGTVPTASPTPSPTPGSSTASATAIVTTSGGTLNFRETPSTSGKILDRIPNATILRVLSRGATWCTVVYNGVTGYVMTSYLTFLDGGGATNPPTQEEDNPSIYTRTLKKGMTGADVSWVQERLRELGYTVNLTGVYDDTTIAAVKKFQSQNGLSADGLAGIQTFTVLASENARRADDAPLSYTTYRIDDTGSGVTSLQKRLKELGYTVTVNGEYDTDTHNAVVAFQQRNSLVISGIADALTQAVLFGSGAKNYSTPAAELEPNAGWIAGPSKDQVQLLHWFNVVKPSVKAGQNFLVFDPNTNLSWTLQFYSLGRHADSQPATWRDTQIMNRSFGKTSWTIHPVYVQLPDGRWTMATMHNRPHLYGSITNNGFGGHLCVHFLRDMSEVSVNDPNYGVQNQETLRSAWKALTGITVN